MSPKLLEYQIQLSLVQILLQKKLVAQAEYQNITLKLKTKYKKHQLTKHKLADKIT